MATAAAGEENRLVSAGQACLEVLRVAADSPGWVGLVETEVTAGLALLTQVRRTAEELAVNQGALWQALAEASGDSSGGGGGGGVQRTPARRRSGEEFGAGCVDDRLDAERRDALRLGTARLRRLLRLSLMDANDLQLARRALREALAFFDALRAAAARARRTPEATWALAVDATGAAVRQ